MKEIVSLLFTLFFVTNLPAEEPNLSKQGTLLNHITAGDIESVSKDLKSDMNVNFTTGTINETTLTLAALNGRAKILEMLIKRKANVNVQTTNGITALMFAAYGNIEGAEKDTFKMPYYLSSNTHQTLWDQVTFKFGTNGKLSEVTGVSQSYKENPARISKWL